MCAVSGVGRVRASSDGEEKFIGMCEESVETMRIEIFQSKHDVSLYWVKTI